jgi:hypothetical protein
MRIPEAETVTDSIVRVDSMLGIVPNHCDAATDAGERIHRLRKEQGDLKRQLAEVEGQLIDSMAEVKARLFVIDAAREAQRKPA